MGVTMIRHTGWYGGGTALVIKINGEKVAKVNAEKLVYVDFPRACYTSRISIWS